MPTILLQLRIKRQLLAIGMLDESIKKIYFGCSKGWGKCGVSRKKGGYFWIPDQVAKTPGGL